MKRYLLPATLVILFSFGCQKKSNEQLVERLTKLEKQVEALEKRPVAAPTPQQAQAEQAQAYDIPVGSSYVLGNPNAPITLVEFTDFQCPFCHKAHESFVDKIKEDPELKDKVKVVLKHYPLSFHKEARGASKAALAAGLQGDSCFWEMSKVLFNNQRELNDENYKKWAKEVKCTHKNGKVAALDFARFESDLKSKDAEFEKIIKEDMELGMSKANVRGTPSFFLNGWQLRGQRSVEALKEMIKTKGMADLKPTDRGTN
jgi:protein-disulfide isomerase